MKAIYLFFCLCTFHFSLYSQRIQGTIHSLNGKAISNATILIKSQKNNVDFEEFFIGKDTGEFSFELANTYKEALYLEFTAFNYSIQLDSILQPQKNKIYEFKILLDEKNQILNEVIVSENKRFEQRGDTTVYSVKAFRDGTERNVEDVLRKLPGVEVNEDDGSLKYLGKRVEAVQLDGDDLFGYRYSTATKNISADMIEKIEAIDNFHANPLFKGMEDSKTTALNLKLKKGKWDLSKNEYVGIGGGNKLALDLGLNLIAVSPKSKTFATFSYNNIGMNSSAFNFFNTTPNQINEENSASAPKLINNKFQNSSLSERRSNINDQKNSNINTIYKFNDRWSLRANMFILKDQLWNEEFSTQQYTVQQQITEYKDKTTSSKSPLHQEFELKLIHNLGTKRHFEWYMNLGDEEVFNDIDFSKNGLNPLKTSLLSRDFLWNQKIDYSQKYKQNLFQFIAQWSNNSSPQIFQPIQNFSFSNSQNTFSNYQSSHFNKNSSLYKFNWIKKLANFNLNYVIKYQTDGLRFRSYLSENDIQVPNFLNDNHYEKSKFTQQAILNYDRKKWKIIFDLSANKWIQHFKEYVSTENIQSESDFLGVHLDVFNDFSNDTKLMLSWKLDKSTIPENYLFINQVVNQNRSTIQNKVALDLVANNHISIGYRKDNLSKGINQSFIFSYLNSKNSFISNISINDNFTKMIYFQSPKSNQFMNGNYTFDKYLYELKWNISHSSNIGWGNNFNEINSTGLRENKQFSYLGTFGIRTMRKHLFDIDNKFIYQFFEYENQDNENINTSLNNSFKLIIHPYKAYSAWLVWEYYRPNLSDSSSFSFLDFKIEHKIKSTKAIKVALLGKNILNQTHFTQISNTSYSTQIFQSSLLPGYWMLTANLEF
ncbi:TonB-dependent receptor [Aquirufa sp. ROCK-SH2]